MKCKYGIILVILGVVMIVTALIVGGRVEVDVNPECVGVLCQP